jgi:Domain of unknown function (DUF4190)/Septum formation
VTLPPGEPPTYGPPPSSPYPPPQGYYPPQAYYPPPPKTNTWAILSLVFGIFGIIGVPISVICGVIGLQKAKQGQGGRGLAIAGLVISGVWVLLLAATLVGSFLYFMLSDDQRGPASYFKAGDCITDIRQGTREVAIVDCNELHRGEVFKVFMLPDGDYPGQAAIREYVNDCEPELATYSPSTVDDPSVSVIKRYPDEESWGLGDRSVTCIATFDAPRTGSIRG